MLKRPPVALIAALACAASLAWAPVLQPPRLALSVLQLLQLRSRAAALLLVGALVHWTAIKLVGCVPLGALSVATFVDQEDVTARRKLVLLPAGALALALAYAVAALQDGAALPGLGGLLLCWLGAALGVALVLSARRGARGWRSLAIGLAAAAGLLAAGLGGALALAVQSEPLVPERLPPSSDQHRELVRLLRGRDPRKIPDGETRSVSLDAQQFDAALAWGASLLRARTRAELRDGGAAVQLALPLRGGTKWLNLSAASQVRLTQGRLEIIAPQLSVGRLTVPSFLLQRAADSALASLRSDADVALLLGALRELSLRPDQLSLTYAAVRGRSGMAARLIYGEEVRGQLSRSARFYLLALLPVLEAAPPGEPRFTAGLQAAFRTAQTRSSQGAATENRAALIALGILLGHPKLSRVLGERFDQTLIQRMEAARNDTSVYARNDWVRHFTVSAALTVLSDVAPSDAIGLLKEELDADGGSGFSFADLLADRAGTTLAARATESEERARKAQSELSTQFALGALLPDPSDLPEGIADAELQARYGGVGGAEFNRLSAEIDRRVAACPLLAP